jgi:opacity protein-like surface antigen
LENNYDLGFVSGHDSIDSSEAGLIVSAGASFELMPNLNAQFQLDYLPKAIKSDEVDFDTDIQSYSVGLQFKF